MDNPTLGTQDTARRQTKHTKKNNATQKTKKMRNIDPQKTGMNPSVRKG